MADKKISDFTAATTLAGGDLLEIENVGGNSRKITATNARKYFNWWYSAPAASDFTVISGDATSPTVTDDADVGVVFDFNGNPVSGDIIRAGVETITSPASAWSYEVRMAPTVFVTGNAFAGLILRNVANNRNLVVALVNDNTVLIQRRSMTAFSATASTLSAAAFANQSAFANLFWKVTYDGSTNVKFYTSSDGKYWRLVYTEAVATYLTAAPDRIGFCMGTATTSSAGEDLNVTVSRRIKSW